MNAMQTPDPIAAAARAELDAIERRLEGTWDIEAGLREILLEEPFHRFVEEQGKAFDVEAGLAAIVAADGDVPDGWLVLRYDEEKVRDTLEATQRFTVFLSECVQDNLNTFDRIRKVADELDKELGAVRGKQFDPGNWDGHLVHASLNLGSTAVSRLVELADDLEFNRTGLEEALQVITAAAYAITQVDGALGRLWREREGDSDHPRRERLVELVAQVQNLRQPVRRLFDPSDHRAEALL